MAIKTLKKWEKSSLDLDKFLNPCDQIDEELYEYVGSIVHPQYCSRAFVQKGEADFKEDGVYFYMTFSRVNEKYYYLGILPEFVQE